MEEIGLSGQSIQINYPELWQYLEPEDVTDLDFNGGQLWQTMVNTVPHLIQDERITENYMNNFAIAAGVNVGLNFNPIENTIYSDAGNHRITCVHKSQSVSGTSVCIRKFKPGLRLTPKKAVETGYASREILNLLYNCVQARRSMAFCGLPGWGKTECLKFCASFNPKYAKAISIEDVGEINYPIINPGACCTELKVRSGDYGKCLETALRMNPAWIFFGESRGAGQVKYLLESWSNGIPTMTTLHLDDCEKIPDRILNMLDSRQDAERIVSQIYADVGTGILIKKNTSPSGTVSRRISQVYFYYRRNGENSIAKVVEDGVLYPERLPDFIREDMEAAIGHKNVFSGPVMNEEEPDEKE